MFVGTTIWSPLASGLLTGKYNDSIPTGSRADTKGYSWLQDRLRKWHKEGKIDKVRALAAFASDRFNCSVGQLAIAWCLKKEFVSTVLLGATKPDQLLENIASLQIAQRMTAADVLAINEILNNTPTPYAGYGQGVRDLGRLPSA